jgi:hypothetical protein
VASLDDALNTLQPRVASAGSTKIAGDRIGYVRTKGFGGITRSVAL